MYLLLIVLPLLSSLSIGLGGRWLGFYGSCIISVTCLTLSCILSILAFFEISMINYSVFIDLSY